MGEELTSELWTLEKKVTLRSKVADNCPIFTRRAVKKFRESIIQDLKESDEIVYGVVDILKIVDRRLGFKK